MYSVKVYVTYKASILDPQGEAVKTALHRLDFTNVESVTQGKYFELMIKKTGKNIDEQVEKMCTELLTNTNMESYTYEIEELTTVEG